MGGAERQDGVGHRQQRVQVERALSPVSDLGGGARLVGLDQAAELPGQDVAAGDRQPALRGRHRGGAVKNILLEPGAVEPPGDHPGTPRRRSECFQRRRRARHREMVVQPHRRFAPGDPGRIGPPAAVARRRVGRWRGGVASGGGVSRRGRGRVIPWRAVDRCRIGCGRRHGTGWHGQRSSTPAGLSLTRPARCT